MKTKIITFLLSDVVILVGATNIDAKTTHKHRSKNKTNHVTQKKNNNYIATVEAGEDIALYLRTNNFY